MSCGQGAEGSSRVKVEDGRGQSKGSDRGEEAWEARAEPCPKCTRFPALANRSKRQAILQGLRGKAHVFCALIDCSFVLLSTPSRRPVTAHSPHSEEAVEGSVGRVQPTQVSAHDVGTSMGSASSADHPLWLPPPHAVDLAGISFPPRVVFKCEGTAVVRVLCCCAEMDSSGLCSPS